MNSLELRKRSKLYLLVFPLIWAALVTAACEPYAGAYGYDFYSKDGYDAPYCPRTTFTVEVPDTLQVLLTVYNVEGTAVATPLDSMMAPGTHHIEWEGRTDDSTLAPSGVYFYRLQIGDSTLVRKMVLMR